LKTARVTKFIGRRLRQPLGFNENRFAVSKTHGEQIFIRRVRRFRRRVNESDFAALVNGFQNFLSLVHSFPRLLKKLFQSTNTLFPNLFGSASVVGIVKRLEKKHGARNRKNTERHR